MAALEETNKDGQGADQRETNFVHAPSISLPKGGGAIHGIGEKFAANPVTGTGSMSVPIATSPGRSGFGPQLSLSYDSGAGNGPFGFGWSLSSPSITHRTDKGLPQYFDASESDVFILSGAEDLVPVLAQNAPEDWVREVVPPLTIDTTTYHIQRYRPRIEGLFARIERWTNVAKPEDVHWRSISKDNILTLYGSDANSRIYDPEDARRIFSWLICETRDDKGNAVLYRYQAEDGQGVDLGQVHERNRGPLDDTRRSANRYLKRICYGNRIPLLDNTGHRPGFLTQAQIANAGWMFEAVFDYGEHDVNAPMPNDAGAWAYRSDPFSTYRARFEVRTTRLCQRVLMFHHFAGEAGVGNDCLVRSTDFSYSQQQDPASARNPIYTFLQAVTQTSYRRNTGGYDKRSLPPVEFEYTQPIVQDSVHDVDAESLENLPIGVDGSAYQWTDLHGEGIPGILTEQAGAWFYKRNLSPIGTQPVEFAPLECVAVKPNLNLAGGAQFMDLNGNGQLDLVMLDGPMPGLYEHDADEGWHLFHPFTSRLNRDMRDPNLKFVDLDGDGHADVLITEDDALVWHPSLEEKGFGPARRVAQALDEENGPRLVFADGTQSIYLADLGGDGLTDLVRIRNGEICYWPNLGYCRFGAKVTMDHAPQFDNPDQFDHKRIRLADIDGSGTTDLIYLHRDGVRLYFNQSGNSWSEPQQLSVFPRVDDLVSIATTDLLGNGTACLVWSSPLPGDARRQMRYVNLMGDHKPHLLIRTVNNLGAETRVQYAPSTQFYLQDKRDGKPWITKLPFPVHVVEKVETFDHISRNRFVTRHAYHHGYFDGVEREFRGFGMVEQWDTEQLTALSDSDVFPLGDNVAAQSHVPPVLTKTWFHTGIYLGRDHVSDFFAGLLNATDQGEYFREPGLTDAEARDLLLSDTVLPPGLTLIEEREACRSLKGAMLRQEVYALDGSDKEPHPYTVTEQNFTIRPLQPQAGNRHSVFFTHAREAISYHYERNPADPRIQHALTLEVDDYGNVLKQAAIGYGRRATIRVVDAQGQVQQIQNPGLSTLSAADRNKQTTLLATYTENRVSNAIATPYTHRNPLPCEARTFELTGYPPTGAAGRFRSADFVQAAGDALTHIFDSEINYEGAPGSGRQRRVIEQVRTLYRADDLSSLLPLCVVESLALPGESYKLAFTPGLAKQIYVDSGKLSQAELDSVLADEGNYVHSENDANWWIPAGRIFFSPDPADDAATELAYAQQHFFLPCRYRDPFLNDTVVGYDANDLLVTDTRDPLGNTAHAEIDYRVLQPWRMTDPNGNHSAAAFDTLGLVVATALIGKNGEGDLLQGFNTDLAQAELNAFFTAPRPADPALLGDATTRILYDVNRWQREGKPGYAATLVRETHVSALPPNTQSKIQVSLSFSDGFGREIQKKIQAEAGALMEGGALVDPRWVGSGWTIFNNKGKPVRQYEPFFDDTHDFKFGKQVGVSPTLFYDPVERVVATLHPNHTFEKVVFDPWRQTNWDVNDTVLVNDPKTDPDAGDFFARLPDADYLPTWYTPRQNGDLGPQEQAAASKAAAHADTPAVAHFDALGRPFLTLADNGAQGKYEARVELDIEGNKRSVTDALGRIVMKYDYSIAGPEKDKEAASRIHQASMDAGQRWTLHNILGNPLRTWDERNHEFRYSYDSLHRPVEKKVLGGDSATPLDHVFEHIEYGESQPGPELKNLRGQIYRHYDTGGMLEMPDYDFKGKPNSTTRRLFGKYKEVANWVGANLVDDLETESFTFVTATDALGRITKQTAPDGSVITPSYNEAGLLDGESVTHADPAITTTYIKNIDYNEKGQRNKIIYGNNVVTRFHYDKETFRLKRLETSRQTEPLQDWYYTFDPIGNITHIEDKVNPVVFFNKQIITAVSTYTYDALYRLLEATGRENDTALSFGDGDNWSDANFMKQLHPGDPMAMRNYTQSYQYDEVGNIGEMKHSTGTVGNWTRSYEYETSSNRLKNTQVGGYTYSYPHHAQHGYITKIPYLVKMGWNFKEELVKTINQSRLDGGTPETTYYQYDGQSQRIRKITENTANPDNESRKKEERIYISGYELYKKHSGNDAGLERISLSLMDKEHRFVMIETRNDVDDGTEKHLVRYQLHNHLGSASLELNNDAKVISYEEYHPYGTTAYQAKNSEISSAAKRYRYTGMERDEETGLEYHSARYYLPWLGRWCSADPIGIGDGVNVYAYVKNRPLHQIDRNGKKGNDTKRHEIHKGETFWNLENKYHYKHGTLQALNKGVNASRLQIGSSINLPGSAPEGEKIAKFKAEQQLSVKDAWKKINEAVDSLKILLKNNEDISVTGTLKLFERESILINSVSGDYLSVKITLDVQRPQQKKYNLNVKGDLKGNITLPPELSVNLGLMRTTLDKEVTASTNVRIGDNDRFGIKTWTDCKAALVHTDRNQDSGMGVTVEVAFRPGKNTIMAAEAVAMVALIVVAVAQPETIPVISRVIASLWAAAKAGTSTLPEPANPFATPTPLTPPYTNSQ